MKEKISDFQTMMLPIVELLKDNQPHSLSEALDYLAKRFPLIEVELKPLQT